MGDPVEISVLGKRLNLAHAADGFRTCLDSVMLAAACPADKNDRILDLGCGVGGVGLCVLVRVDGTSVTGVDIQHESVDLAGHNAQRNKLSKRSDFIVSDVRSYKTAHGFDHVVCNPPYMEGGDHTPSPRTGKAIAHGHHGLDTTIRDWVDAAYRTLKPRGSFTIIHRADRTDKIIQAMQGRFGQVEIIPLWPKRGVQAKRAIIRAIKDRKSPAVLHPGLVLHDENDRYTKEADLILRGGEALYGQD